MMGSLLRTYSEKAEYAIKRAQMNYSGAKTSTLIFEGDTDAKFVRNFLTSQCIKVLTVDGKQNVVQAWKMASQRRLPYIHFFVDLDYDAISGKKLVKHDNFHYVLGDFESDSIKSYSNDIESALLRTSALRKILAQKYCSDSFDLVEIQSHAEMLRERLRIAGAELGSLRAAEIIYYGETRERTIDGGFNIDDQWYVARDIRVDRSSLRSSLMRSCRGHSSAMERVFSIADELLETYGSGWELSRGHDLTEMLSRYLTSHGSRIIRRPEVESDLRIACEFSFFENTPIGKVLHSLEKHHGDKVFSS